MLTTCNKEIIFLQWKWRWENRITLFKLYSCGKWVFMPSSLERKFISLHQLTLLINNLCIKYTNWEAQGVILLHVLPFHIAKLCFSEGGENLCPILHQKNVIAKHLFSIFYRHYEKSKSMKFVILILMQNYRALGNVHAGPGFPGAQK